MIKLSEIGSKGFLGHLTYNHTKSPPNGRRLAIRWALDTIEAVAKNI